jgi:hypothetical protein
MVWVVLVLAAVSWLVVTLILEQERGKSVSIRSRISARQQQLRVALSRLRSSRRSAPLRFRVEPAKSRRVGGPRAPSRESSRSRLVALIELILFVVLISALFAGAIAAAALHIGHLGA